MLFVKVKFPEVYEETKDVVYGYLYYMTKDKSLAEDLSQETFLKIYQNLKKFKGQSSIKTWCLTVARNTFLSFARKKKPVLLEEQYLETIPEYYENIPESNVLKREEAERIAEVLAMLRADDRTILLLRDYEGLSYTEIAAVMELSETAVKARIHRARERFRKLFQNKKEVIE